MEIDFDFSASFGEVKTKMDRLLEQGRRKWWPRTLQASLTQAVAGTYTMDFGQPARGTLWNPIGLTLSGVEPSYALTAVTRAVFFIGDVNNVVPGQAVANLEGATTGSFSLSFPREGLWVYPTEDPFLRVVTSGAVQIYGSVRVHEYRQDDIEPKNA